MANPINEIPGSNNTFQDTLLTVTKVFWKAGFQYSKKGMQEDFYAVLLDDFMNMPYNEFLRKYDETQK